MFERLIHRHVTKRLFIKIILKDLNALIHFC